MDTVKGLIKKPLYRYILVGGSVYLIELLVILTAQHLGATAVWAIAIAFCIGTIIAFFFQKLITFKDRRMHHRVVVPQLIATGLLIAFNLGFSVLVTKLAQNHLPAVVSRTLALGITTTWNFYLYKTTIFRQSGTGTPEILG